jgi:hypothetical protein
MSLDPTQDRSLRDHLLELLKAGSAHLGFDEAVDGLPAGLRGKNAPSLVHTVWQLVEHLRITQVDILEFSRNPDYKEIKWPDDYWPETEAPPSGEAWEQSVEAFRRDLQAMKDLVADPKTDLFAKIPWGSGQTILREAMLVADHNAYHVGQIVTVRQGLGAW